MIELLYQVLGRMGYTHPVHPTLTHIVVGMVLGAFLFGFVSWVRRRATLALTNGSALHHSVTGCFISCRAVRIHGLATFLCRRLAL